MKHKIHFKQILAIFAVVIILALYITTFVLAVMGKEYHDMFLISLYTTVCVPVFLYIVIWLRRVLKDRVG